MSDVGLSHGRKICQARLSTKEKLCHMQGLEKLRPHSGLLLCTMVVYHRVFVSVLQRKRDNRRWVWGVCGGVDACRIYYKELAHVIKEADRSQDLQGELAICRPTRPDDVVLAQRPSDLGPRRSQCFSQSEGIQTGGVLLYSGKGQLFCSQSFS